MKKHIKSPRPDGLPLDVRQNLKAARLARGWSQAELGQKVGLPQTHVSNIEAGRVVPRFDTLLEIVRTLGHDLLMVPRSLVPAVEALVRDQHDEDDTEEERPLYADDGPR
jgi:transcriptional regulator with XRE-family HTH domain